MVLRQAQEAEKTAGDIWETLKEDVGIEEEWFIRMVSPILKKWERDLLYPHIERILQLDGELNLLRISLKQKEHFLEECLSKVAQRKGQA